MAAGAPPPQLAECKSGSWARSAPPPSRRLLARVAPAEPPGPPTPAGRVPGAGALPPRRWDGDPRPAWGRGQGRAGARAGREADSASRRLAFPRRRIFPTPKAVLPPHRRCVPRCAGRSDSKEQGKGHPGPRSVRPSCREQG